MSLHVADPPLPQKINPPLRLPKQPPVNLSQPFNNLLLTPHHQLSLPQLLPRLPQFPLQLRLNVPVVTLQNLLNLLLARVTHPQR